MKLKTLILIPVWGRLEVLEIVLKNLLNLKRNNNIEVLCIISEQWAKLIVSKYGFKWTEYSNEDLGLKMNWGVKMALKYDWEYLMGLGSDDILTQKLLTNYDELMAKNVPIFGVKKIGFLDIKTKSIKEVNYGHLIGAGRMIRRDILVDKCVSNGNVNMYDKGLQRGLDNNSRKRFLTVSMHELDYSGNLMIDLKSADNIWKFEDLKGELKDLDYLNEIDSEIIENIMEL